MPVCQMVVRLASLRAVRRSSSSSSVPPGSTEVAASIAPSPATASSSSPPGAAATSSGSPLAGRRQIPGLFSNDAPSGSGREEVNSTVPSGPGRGPDSPFSDRVSRRAGSVPAGSSSHRADGVFAPCSSASWIAASTRPPGSAATEASRGRRSSASGSEKSVNSADGEDGAGAVAAGASVSGVSASVVVTRSTLPPGLRVWGGAQGISTIFPALWPDSTWAIASAAATSG